MHTYIYIYIYIYIYMYIYVILQYVYSLYGGDNGALKNAAENEAL